MFRYSSDLLRTPIRNNEEPSSSKDVNKTYKCEFCSKEWQWETELYYHKKQHYKKIVKHAKKGAHFCWTCIRHFKTSEQLTSHFKRCHLLSSKKSQRVEREIYACDYCDNIFFNKTLLVIHIMHVHLKNEYNDRKKYITCPICNKSINLKYIWGHFHSHHFSLRTCKICLKESDDWKGFEIHLKEHPLYLHCDICNINFREQSAYTKHVEAHLSIETELDIEEDALDTEKYFIPKVINKRQSFGKLLPYCGLKLQPDLKICILCREICSNFTEQLQHIQRHDPNNAIVDNKMEKKAPNPSFACSCGEVYEHRILLKQHMMRNKGSADSHEELSATDIANLISREEFTIVEILDM